MVPWFFLTPIFYEPSKLPGIDRHPWAETLLTWVNPVAPFIQAVRDVLYDGRVPGAGVMAYVLVAGVVGLAAGQLLFRRAEGELAVVL